MGDSSTTRIGQISSYGKFWDEKGRSEIVQIFVSHDDFIHSVQFQFYESGKLVLSDRHGKVSGTEFDVVRFDYPSEYLTCVSGFQNNYYGPSITSITFATNMKTYGPFGKPDCKKFRFQLGRDRQFGGFCGSADDRLRSIGVYFKPISILKIQQKQTGSRTEEDEDAEAVLQV